MHKQIYLCFTPFCNSKRFLLFINFVIISLYAKGQTYFGISGGLSFTNLETNDLSQSFSSVRNALGVEVKINYKYEPTRFLAICVRPGFVQKDYRIVRNGFYQGVKEKHINNFLQLPVTGMLSLGGKRLKVSMEFGGYVGYWISARIKGIAPNILNVSDTTTQNPTNIFATDNLFSYSERYRFNKKDRRVELGWLFGVGLLYPIGNRYECFFNVQFDKSLTDLENHIQTNQPFRYNTTETFELGILMNWSSLRHLKF